MKKYLLYILIQLFILIIHNKSIGQGVRPIRDDVGYCWKLEQLEALMKFLKNQETILKNKYIIAGISPHDDYLYAARVYYPLFSAINTKEAIIFGVTHGTVRKEIGDPKDILLFDNYSEWLGLRKNIKVSGLREYIINRLDTSYYKINNRAHELEHSIEGLLPFLQYFNPEIIITPIMVTAMSFERMEEVSQKLSVILSAYIKVNNLTLGKDIVFLISSDANHYGKDFNNTPFDEDSLAHWKATEQDRRIANDFLSGIVNPKKIKDFTDEMKNVVWCGKFSVPMGLLTANKAVELVTGHKLNGTILRYSDTFTEGVLPIKGTELGTTAPFSLKHWCGFLSAAYSLMP